MAPDGHATGSGTLISSSNKLQLGGMAPTGQASRTWAQGGVLTAHWEGQTEDLQRSWDLLQEGVSCTLESKMG